MRFKRVFIILFLFIPVLLAGQGELDTQKHIMLRDESTLGAFIYSNGMGINYRYGRWIDARNELLFDVDLNYLKDPKEIKTVVTYNYNLTRSYVLGKENLFWELKGSIGKQSELYRKRDKSGISIRYFYNGGFSLGFLKPIYYEILTVTSTGELISEGNYLKYDETIHSYIGGRGPFLMGFDELKVIPGLSIKSGFSFEFSDQDVVVHAVELGCSFTVYPMDIPIMATDENNFLFFNLFAGYRFGNVINISEAARAKSWKERRNDRKQLLDQQGPAIYSPFR